MPRKRPPLLLAEIRDGSIYLSAVDKKHVLELQRFCERNADRFKERGYEQVTCFERLEDA